MERIKINKTQGIDKQEIKQLVSSEQCYREADFKLDECLIKV